ncbi:MAG: galactose-1-epimerase, partial [Firmicutes bacterium]|nr:galactose-1-epimerase [Bacillota bacterium]
IASVVYRLKAGELSIQYTARSSGDTICNLSNHAYFNLSGQDSGTVENHTVRIDADFYGETDEYHVIKKQPAAVEGTTFDFRESRTVGHHNYDHHYFCNGNGFRNVGEVYSDDTGIEMSVLTDMPGMQFYTGNFLKNLPTGKAGAEYHSRSGLCLETQYPPNAVNCPEFQQPLLRAGEEYRHVTIYKFSLRP